MEAVASVARVRPGDSVAAEAAIGAKTEVSAQAEAEATATTSGAGTASVGDPSSFGMRYFVCVISANSSGRVRWHLSRHRLTWLETDVIA